MATSEKPSFLNPPPVSRGNGAAAFMLVLTQHLEYNSVNQWKTVYR